MSKSSKQLLLDNIKQDSQPEKLKGNIATVVDRDLIKYDNAFKSVFKYAGPVALVLKYTIKELQKYSIEQILGFMVPEVVSKGYSCEQAFETELPLRASEDGDIHDKNIRYDLRFDIKIPGDDLISTILLTLDFEMQKEYATKYSMVSRAVYYSAALLRSTLKGTDDYTNINKVYSIWFCGKNEVELEKYAEKLWFHRYAMLRCYNEDESSDIYKNKSTCKYDKDADLMQVIMIELDKVSELQNKELNDIVHAFFKQNDKNVAFNTINRYSKVNLTKTKRFEEGVSEMYTEEQIREAYTAAGVKEGMEKGREEGREEGRRESINQVYKSYIELGLTREQSVVQLAKTFNRTKSEIEEIIE